MALPTSADVHVDSALTNISVAYIQNMASFISTRAFPNVPVMKQSDQYFVFNRGDMNRDEARVRAPGTESAGGGFKLDNTPTYFCKPISWHQDVDLQTLANADAALDLEDAAARYVMQKLLIKRERDFASNYMATSVWDTDITGVDSSPTSVQTIRWDADNASSDPIVDVQTGKETILGNTGFEPNTLILGYKVFSELKNHPDIIDRIKYSGGVGNESPALADERTLAQVFGVERVLVSKAVYNSAAEGLTESSGFVVGNDAMLCYSAPSPGIMTPTAGYTFSWRGYLNQTNDFGIATKRFEMPHLESNRIEGAMAYDQKVVSSEMGYFWDAIVTA